MNKYKIIDHCVDGHEVPRLRHTQQDAKNKTILVRNLLYKYLRKLKFGWIRFKYILCRISIPINMELEEKSTEHEEHECNESFIR
jgi:hypothetical protein